MELVHCQMRRQLPDIFDGGEMKCIARSTYEVLGNVVHTSKRAAVDQQSLEFTTNKVLWSMHIRPTVSSCIGSPSFFNDVLQFQRKVAPHHIQYDLVAIIDSSNPEMHHQSNSQSEWRTERRQRRSRHLLTSWFRSVGPFEAQRIRRNDTAATAAWRDAS